MVLTGGYDLGVSGSDRWLYPVCVSCCSHVLLSDSNATSHDQGNTS